MERVKHEIKKSYGVISTTPAGWKKELNLVSWNDAEPKYDIRQWSPDHTAMGKGISLTREEARNLCELLKKAEEEGNKAAKAEAQSRECKQ